ncbi:hypothetical protein [Candidatus Pelagibacter sp. HIMB109]|uniref:hypothetical protein n=1 Tax=Candidatus Pelagibacter sp. HIMB109 TaxID=3415412 RepID=UPI003F864E15
MREKTRGVQDKIFDFCKSEKKHTKEIARMLNDMNINTLRTVYVYPMVKQGRLKRVNARYYISVTGFKKVTLDQWKALGLPEEINSVSFVNKK